MATQQQVRATEAQVFVDWTSRDSERKATGKLGGRTVTVSGVTGTLGAVDINGEHTEFGSALFTPQLPSSDSVELRSRRDDTEFKIDFGGKVQDAILHLGSLASIMTFEAGTTVTRISGDADFKVPQSNMVTGRFKEGPPTDSNGTIHVSKSDPFSSITFKLRLNYDGTEEGVYLQFGRTVEFVDWTSRDSERKATGKLGGRTVTVSGVTGTLGAVDINGEHTEFGSALFTPQLPSSDSVELRSRRDDTEFKIDFGGKVQDAILHLGSLASIMTFEAGTTVTRISGDADFKVPQGNMVTGKPKEGPPTDSNGTIHVSKSDPFSSITFKLRLNYDGTEEGVYLQFGR
ncbi:hypothetical protein PV963_10720 [Streptomyces coeruleorubidus]|uniref:hypothetical protein n=1 Tax=Streptomyces coeruleorubidus TaxID=116188 RepID=UPI00237F8200|nr:hypothetical protein [Streptomyces coeruleorubidus]WDV50799.1 hypothetical protein PV963_10720 [Streptomyces coeruleorubidus]